MFNFDDLDFNDILDLLPDDTNQTGTDPTTGGGGGSSDLDFTGLLKGLEKFFAGTSPFGKAGAAIGAGILGKVMDKALGGGQQGPAGYQGGIPVYTMARQQTPLTEQRPTTTGANGKVIPYRPGQGGIRYFTPTTYTATGKDMAAPTAGTVLGAPPPPPGNAAGGYMPGGGIAMLARGGSGSRYLRGAGDGVSDSIPAKFEQSGQPARLADGEFVIDARTVSELGNGSSEAGARKLYAMLDRVHSMRKQAERGKPSGADRELNKLVRGKQ